MTDTATKYRCYVDGVRLCAKLRPLELSYSVAVLWTKLASPRKQERELVLAQMQSCASQLKLDPEHAWDDYLWHAGANTLHTYLYGSMNPRWLGRSIKVIGEQYLRAAFSQKRGVLILTAHQHSMMLLAVTLGLLGMQTYPILMDPRLTVPDFLRDYGDRAVRDSTAQYHGGHYLYVDYNQSFVRPVYRMLQAGHVVLSANDFPSSLAPKRRCVIPFLGREISCPTGSVDIAIDTGAVIVPAFILRQHGRIVTEFHAPLSGPVGDVMAAYGKLLEDSVRRDPGAWEGWKWPDVFDVSKGSS